MEQSHYWEADSRSAHQEIIRLLRNPKVHYHVHNNSPPVLTLSHMIHPTIANPTALRSILILFSHVHLAVSSTLPFRLSNQYLIGLPFLISHMHATCPWSHAPWSDHPSNIRWTVEIMKLFIVQFSSTSVTTSLLGRNMHLSTLFSNTLNVCSSLNVRDQVTHPYNR
jgi:hypothetical protein